MFVHWAEQGLITVLALGIVGLGVMFTSADSQSVNLSLTVLPAGGSITVTAPDGGEDWEVDQTKNITWTSAGEVINVKIEIQRTTGGEWDTIIESTTNDGSHPWIVTSPTGSQNTIRISEVGDAGVNDTSNGTFTISSTSGGGGGNQYLLQPGIGDVSPMVVINNSDVVLDITGINFKPNIKFYLDAIPLKNNTRLSNTHARATVPAGIGSSMRRLYAYNTDGTYTYWGALIKIIHQSKDGSGANIPDIIKLYLHPNEVHQMDLTFKNYTNYTWDQNLKLGTVEPRDRNSLFHNPILWPSNNRVARYTGNAVGYNEEATLNVSFKAPAEVGKYTEKFGLVLEGVKWLNISPVTVQITVIDEDEELPEPPSTGGLPGLYSAKWVRQSPYLQLRPGQTGELWVEFKNTGTLPWYSFGDNPVKLGTSWPNDRSSIFKNSDWLSNNRVALVTKPGSTGLASQVVEPGEMGRFTFTVMAPNKVKKYREYFRPVVEYKQWLPDYGVYWDITVTGSTVSNSIPPSTGGSSLADFFQRISKPKALPVPSQPNPISTGTGGSFQDSTEGAIQNFVSSLNQLFSGIANFFSGWF